MKTMKKSMKKRNQRKNNNNGAAPRIGARRGGMRQRLRLRIHAHGAPRRAAFLPLAIMAYHGISDEINGEVIGNENNRKMAYQRENGGGSSENERRAASKYPAKMA
jgi:hypothetical protein